MGFSQVHACNAALISNLFVECQREGSKRLCLTKGTQDSRIILLEVTLVVLFRE